jgi:hypothetical protein
VNIVEEIQNFQTHELSVGHSPTQVFLTTAQRRELREWCYAHGVLYLEGWMHVCGMKVRSADERTLGQYLRDAHEVRIGSIANLNKHNQFFPDVSKPIDWDKIPVKKSVELIPKIHTWSDHPKIPKPELFPSTAFLKALDVACKRHLKKTGYWVGPGLCWGRGATPIINRLRKLGEIVHLEHQLCGEEDW